MTYHKESLKENKEKDVIKIEHLLLTVGLAFIRREHRVT